MFKKKKTEKLIFEKSIPNRRGFTFSSPDNIKIALDSKFLRESEPKLPELSEFDVVRHFTRLSQLNFSLDTNFYPLGSCTMKYNPKITEKIASLSGFTDLHPMLLHVPNSKNYYQGALEVVYELEDALCQITGMNACSLQPMAGAHGELAGVMIIAAYHKAKNNQKKYVIIPDSAHGTNPASAAMVGYEIITIPSLANGEIDFEILKGKLTSEVAAIMLTCPNTLGIFETKINEIAALAHKEDALLYYDGANLNAILGKVRPGDLGFDIIHINLHKTFATPHGTGGPGAGPIGVKEKLTQFLPGIKVIKNQDNTFDLDTKSEESIGILAPFFGNFLVLLKALVYIKLLGKEGLTAVSEIAVLNANYLLAKLKSYFKISYENKILHEVVFSAEDQAKQGVRALDIAKALIDKGIHPCTIYFPLIVKEALMIEPTETESKETLDEFILILEEILKEANENPGVFINYPETTLVSRLDETKAARDLVVQAN
ncbi:MAG: aminomethyl-transferring glycine dehydrogenase subunit GcvPB [Candidatus Margulisiibacteriota bacterium]